MKKYSLSILLFALCMLVTAAGAAMIVAPGYPQEEILPPGSTGVFPVSVGGLTGAQGVHFNLTFDNTLLSIESVSTNTTIPGSEATAKINNEIGWVQVAVTNTEGITAGDIWPLPPLVDITFRATENEGVSAMVFSGTPTYSQGEAFMPVDFDRAYSGSIAVRGPSTIQAPSGTLSSGQPGTFAVGVNNVTGVTKIWFELMYDGSYLIIDDIAPALPGAVITLAHADNGIHEFEPYALASVPEEMRLELQQHGHNFAVVNLEIPGGLTATEYTDIVDITFRSTNRTGTSEIDLYAWYGSYEMFDLQVPGRIVTSGGGSYPGLGEFKAPSGTIDIGSQKVLPIEVRSLNNADGAYISAEWNSTIINVTSVLLNATAEKAGVTFDGYIGSYSYEPIGYLWGFIENLTNLNTASWTPLLDLTMRANAGSGQTPMNISGISYMVPRENVSISFSPLSLENGQISITVPEMADLVGILVDPPRYVKKYADGSLHFTQTMIIANIGNKIVTEDFKAQWAFDSSKMNITIKDDIAPGANITCHMTMNVVPDYGEADIVITERGYERWYNVTTGGNVSVGDYYSIGLAVDLDNTVDEINEENNYEEIQVEITLPDLVPIWQMEFVHGIPSSNTTILDTSVTPGVWRVTIGAKNIGNVFAVPTALNYSVNGKPPQPHVVPRLEPGENWTMTFDIAVDRAIDSYRVEVNADRAEAETNYANNIYEESIGSIAPVTIVLPKVSGSLGDDTEVAIWITNISSTAPITAFQIPVKYDPTVCSITQVSTIPGVTVTHSYGRVTLTANNLVSPLESDTQVATLKMRALADAGRTSVLDTQKSAYVKTDGGAFLELEITRGAFAQNNETDAAVTVFASPRGPFNQNQTVSVTVQNQRLNPVTVSANLAANDASIWSMPNINLAGRASKTFTINTWKPTVGGTYFLNATITGDDVPAGNFASRSIFIDDYQLEITDQNRWYWDSWYGYNRSVLTDEYFTLGTYFTTNQSGTVNATLAMTHPNGTPVNLTDNSAFEFYYYYPAQSVYAYDSEWNCAIWYYIRAKQLGDYNYSITLKAREKNTYINGTIKVREPSVDIKVMNTTLVTTENSKTMTFAVFNRTPSEGRNVQLLLSAGADGRTLQGLESLIGYPHGCPEQVMSPALAALRVKQYYEERGALNDQINSTVRTAMQSALDHMNPPDGYNAQQLAGRPYGDGSGGWAWGTSAWSTPSMFYTFYPNYVITELLRDNDPTFWNVDTNMDQIDLDASANWLIRKQQSDGRWSDWSYISNDVEWTGFISENLVNEYPYLNNTMKGAVDASLARSCNWLLAHDYTNEGPQALSYAILGLVAIREHGIGDAGAINGVIQDLRGKLEEEKIVSGTETYWSDPSRYDTYEPTASAILALSKSGTLADELSGGINHLIGNRAGRSYSGGWGSTRTSAAVINTLTVVVPQKPGVFTVDVRIEREDGTLVWSRNGLEFTKTSFSFDHTLSASELNTLYDSGKLNETAKVVISNKTDTDPELIAKLSVSIDSFEQVPKSIATATIPDMYIDPLATDFELQINVPAPGSLKEGNERVVGFTIDNTKDDSTDQNTMIIEIPISNEVNFIGSANGADTAFYGTSDAPTYITHMYNAIEKVLYIYPGSDDASAPSVRKGEAKTFSIPLTFGASGNITVEARVYPMYNDTWMALGTGSTYVLGYGNITLAAVDETDAPVNADFYVDGVLKASGTSTYTDNRLLEGGYSVGIKKDSVWINSTVNVAPSESATYTTYFASDRSIPYIAQAEGTAGEIRLMPPEIEDTTDDASPNHWNAAIPAMKSFKSTIASNGGRATIAVEIPTITRAIGTVELNETVVVLVHSASGWFSIPSSGYSLEGGVLTLFNIDTADIDEVSIRFEGGVLGDVNNDGRTNLIDAIFIARHLVGNFNISGNAAFYADTDDSGRVKTADAIMINRYLVCLMDDNFQPL